MTAPKSRQTVPAEGILGHRLRPSNDSCHERGSFAADASMRSTVSRVFAYRLHATPLRRATCERPSLRGHAPTSSQGCCNQFAASSHPVRPLLRRVAEQVLIIDGLPHLEMFRSRPYRCSSCYAQRLGDLPADPSAHPAGSREANSGIVDCPLATATPGLRGTTVGQCACRLTGPRAPLSSAMVRTVRAAVQANGATAAGLPSYRTFSGIEPAAVRCVSIQWRS